MNYPDFLLEDIALALQTDGMMSYYDQEEKAVIVLHESPEDDSDEEETLLRAQILEFPERYLLIEPFPKWKTFNVMDGFIGVVDDKEVSSRLSTALRQPRPFANFRRVLNYYPDWLMKWYRFEEAYYIKAARKWLGRVGS